MRGRNNGIKNVRKKSEKAGERKRITLKNFERSREIRENIKKL